MDDQWVVNLKGDFNTEGTKYAEKTGRRKGRRKDNAETLRTRSQRREEKADSSL